jgi:glycosyltransferase involved in cell wall biosynthesis
MLPIIALVTAYNEEKTIGGVIDVLKNCPSVDRIQVVDDGSTDRTREVALSKRVKVYTLPQRIQVGKAIMHHLRYIPEKQCVLLWCDADLIGLRVAHIERIISNLIKSGKAMSVGFKDTVFFFDLKYSDYFPQWWINSVIKLYSYLDWHTAGERAIYRDVFEKAVSKTKIANGYGLVMLMNWYCKKRDKGYVVSFNKGLTHRVKWKKWGLCALLEIPVEIMHFVVGYLRLRLQFRRIA